LETRQGIVNGQDELCIVYIWKIQMSVGGVVQCPLLVDAHYARCLSFR